MCIVGERRENGGGYVIVGRKKIKVGVHNGVCMVEGEMKR